jgi:alanine dehydrogenase
LQAILEKKIALFDHETIVDQQFKRLIGFGRYAGIVGAYNGFRAFGLKFDLFSLPKAETLSGREVLVQRLRRLTLPPIKIILTGKGKVATGAKEILDAMKIKEVSVEDFLMKNFNDPVYCQIDVDDYYKRIDDSCFDRADFYRNPIHYTSNFERFTRAADVFMAGHFAAADAPVILSQNMLMAAANKIKVVADISCDVNGPIACTIRASTIADPFYGYLPISHQEVDFFHPASIAVMAVDNLPCELPRDASEGFGDMFLQHVVPAFFNHDENGILERAQITESGKLTPRFSYLQDYVNNTEK